MRTNSICDPGTAAKDLFFKNRMRPFFILILLGLFLFLWRAGNVTFIDEDEAMYSEVAQEMVQSNDWVYPHCNYNYWVDKPPLICWMTALSFKITGLRTEFIIRFWHSILALFGVLLTYLFAEELFGPKTGFFSGLALMTGLQYFYQARMVLCDIALTFFITLCLYFFMLFLRRNKLLFFYLSVISSALAVMTKGPVGAGIPFLIGIVYLIIIKRNPFKGKVAHIFLSLGLFFLIVAPWFIAQTVRYKKYFIEQFFFFKNFERILHPIDVASPSGKPDPFYTYVFFIAIGFLPWAGVVFYGFFSFIKKYFKERKKEELFIILWAGIIFLFFSFVGMKVPRYIMPIYPALAIITGRFFSDDGKKVIVPFWLSVILAPLLIGAVVVAKYRFPKEAQLYINVLSPTLIILGVGILVSSLLLFKNKKLSFASFFTSAYIAYIVLIIFAYPVVNTVKISKSFALEINRTLKLEDKIINYRPPDGEEPSLVFYTNHKVVLVMDEKQLDRELAGAKKVFFVLNRSDLDLLKEKNGFSVLKESQGRILCVYTFSQKKYPPVSFVPKETMGAQN